MNDYFKENQKFLLELVNTEAGRFLLGIKDKDLIVKLSPNSIHQLRDIKDEKAIIEAKFYSGNAVEEILEPILTKMQIAANSKYFNTFIQDKYGAFLHYANLKNKTNLPQIFLNTTNFNPSATGMGWIRNSGNSWATVQGAASGNSVTSNTTGGSMSGGLSQFVTNTYYIDRVFFPVDTSALTTAAIITSASFTGYLFNGITNADSTDVRIVLTTQPSTSTLALSDFINSGGVSGGSATLASLTNAALNTITLNATGRGWINLTGFTKIGWRLGRDIDNVAPTGVNQIANMNTTNDASNKPFLTVVYTLLSGGFFLAAQ